MINFLENFNCKAVDFFEALSSFQVSIMYQKFFFFGYSELFQGLDIVTCVWKPKLKMLAG